MRAAVLHKLMPIEQNPLKLEDTRTPEVERQQVLVKIAACGVCRTTLHMIEGDWEKYGTPAKIPVIPGHEIVGIIVALGESVDSWKVGDRVGMQPLWSSCGSCEHCLTGREHMCPSKLVTGDSVDGGYAEYVIGNANHVYAVPDNLRDSEAAPLFCAGITAYGAVTRAKLTSGRKVAIFGIGGVGQMVLQLSRLSDAETIAVSGSAQHLKLAQELGASMTIDASKKDPVNEIKEIGGVDSSIVFAPSNELARKAFRSTKPGGIIVLGVNADFGEIPFSEQKQLLATLPVHVRR